VKFEESDFSIHLGKLGLYHRHRRSVDDIIEEKKAIPTFSDAMQIIEEYRIKISFTES